MAHKPKSSKADLAVSTRAKLGRPITAVSAGKVEDSENLNIPAGCKLVPRSVLYAHLDRAERDLRLRQTHPENCVRYGVPEELARSLAVAAARIPARHQSLNEAELVSLAAAEAESVRAAEARLEPIIARARKHELPLEDLLEAVREEGSEKIGLNRFVSFSSDATSIVDDEHVRRASAVPVPSLYDAQQPYQVAIMVKEFSPAKGEVKLLLRELPAECPLFSKKDIGRCEITLKSFNERNRTAVPGLARSLQSSGSVGAQTLRSCGSWQGHVLRRALWFGPTCFYHHRAASCSAQHDDGTDRRTGRRYSRTIGPCEPRNQLGSSPRTATRSRRVDRGWRTHSATVHGRPTGYSGYRVRMATAIQMPTVRTGSQRHCTGATGEGQADRGHDFFRD